MGGHVTTKPGGLARMRGRSLGLVGHARLGRSHAAGGLGSAVGRSHVCIRRSLATFGEPALRSAADLSAHARSTLVACEELAERAANGTEVVSSLDALSCTISNALDAYECARNVHPEKEYVAAADAAHDTVSARLNELNTDERLYASIRDLLADDGGQKLSVERQRFARAMAAEFEHDGAHLSSVERGRLRALQAQEGRLAQQFAAGCDSGGGGSDEGVWVSTEALRGASAFPDRVLGALPSRTVGGSEALLHGKGESQTRVPPERSALTAAMQRVRCEETRRRLYESREVIYRRNHAALDELVATRGAIATALGHSSYAACAMSHGRMESEPNAVAASLARLSARVGPMALSELSGLQQHFSGGGSVLQPWDLGFVMERASDDAAASAAVAAAGLSEYLELEAALDGVATVLSEAFGLRLAPVAAAPNELWHPSVRKLLLSAPAHTAAPDTPLGVLYLDMCPRAGKSGQPALYTLRAAGDIAPMDNSAGDESSRLLLRHLPAAALVIDLPVTGGAGSHPRSGAALLSPRQLSTLFHEFGHALHALVARTETHHFAGVRTHLDFVEVPALLFERFATDPTVLSRWARHHVTGAPLPPELAAAAALATRRFTGLDLQSQCLHALTDLALHGSDEASGGGVRTSSQLVHDLTIAHTVLPVDSDGDGPAWHGGFRHLAGYGAGYYTYLWARSLSARVWSSCFEGDPLNGASGARWRQLVLAHGGAREPREMLREMLDGGVADAAVEEGEADAAVQALVEL